MPLDKKPTTPAKPWIPDLLFEPVARFQSPAEPASSPPPEQSPAAEASPAEAAAVASTVAEAPVQLAERPYSPAPASAADSDDPVQLRRVLEELEKTLRSLRIARRNLQEELSKAKRAFMFAERTRVYGAKGAVDALIAQDQQSEAEERRLTSEILAVRVKLDRSQR
jgi:hypothetical protein